MSDVILSDIIIYPIKSLGGISLAESTVEEKGLQYDRRWMIVDEKGQFLTQREYPVMATLQIQLEADHLKVTSKKGKSLIVPFAENEAGEIKRVKVWESKLKARVCKDSINEWLSNALGTNCQLVQMNESSRRIVSPYYAIRKYKDTVSFADAYPMLLIGEDSLNDLNEQLDNPVPMNRFRPNLVVKKSGAFAEDKWKKIRIGETIFHIVKPCARCVMTTINQETGALEGKDPLKTLASYRTVKRAGKSKVLFGQNLIAESFNASVKIGDKVEILEVKK